MKKINLFLFCCLSLNGYAQLNLEKLDFGNSFYRIDGLERNYSYETADYVDFSKDTLLRSVSLRLVDKYTIEVKLPDKEKNSLSLFWLDTNFTIKKNFGSWDKAEYAGDGRYIVSRATEQYSTTYSVTVVDENNKVVLPELYNKVARAFNYWLVYKEPDKTYAVLDWNGKHIADFKNQYFDDYGPYQLLWEATRIAIIDKDGINYFENAFLLPGNDCPFVLTAIKHGKGSLLDLTTKKYIPFDGISDYYGLFGDLLCVQRKDKWGLYDKTGKEILPVKYVDIKSYGLNDQKLIIANDTSGYTFYDKNGNKLIDKSFSSMNRPYEAGYLYLDGHDCHWKFEDYRFMLNGIAKPFRDVRYSCIKQCSDDLFMVNNMNNKWGMVNGQNEIKIPLLYDNIILPMSKKNYLAQMDLYHTMGLDFTGIEDPILKNGYACQLNNQWGIYRADFKKLVDPQYSYVYELCYEGNDIYVLNERDSFYGWINIQSGQIIKPMYKKFVDVDDGWMVLYKDTTCALADTTGKIWIGYGKYADLGYAGNNRFLANLPTGEHVLIDSNGTELGKWNEYWVYVHLVEKDLYSVSRIKGDPDYRDWYYSYIDQNGKPVIKTEYYQGSKFVNGKAVVVTRDEHKIWLIDHEGKMLKDMGY